MRTAWFWLAAACIVALIAVATRVVEWVLFVVAALMVVCAVVAALRHWRRRHDGKSGTHS